MHLIETIIFDLGGVLIDWDPRHLYRKIFDDEAAMERFLQEVTTPEWNEEQDAGRPLAEATEGLLRQHPQYETEIRAFYGRWPEMLNGPIEGSLDILEALYRQDSHRLYALTNWSAETFPVAQARYAFLQWFEGILVSGKEKLKKPDPRIFQLLLDRYDIDAPRSLFIDDNLRNVEAARAVGISAIHFQGPDQLRTALAERGVILND